MNSIELRQHIIEQGRLLYRSMPWRDDTRPYFVLVSELMLQQTQVDRVIPKFRAFIERFPDEYILAAASLSEVLGEWQGLGYNRRAKYLHDAAKKITQEYKGRWPETLDEWRELPGVGPNTAGALMAYIYNVPVTFVETNIRTVLFHHCVGDQTNISDTELLKIADRLLNKTNPRAWYWALMDYGSWLKRQGVKNITKSATYRKQAPLKGSVREVRGEIIRTLHQAGSLSKSALMRAVQSDERFAAALEGLVRDGLINIHDEVVNLTK